MFTAAGAEEGKSEKSKPTVWDRSNQFDGWKQLRNIKCKVKDGLLVLTDIQNDPQLVSGPMKLDPARYQFFSFRYRYENPAGSKKMGQLYFAHANGRFSDRARWDIPKLIADGQWHTMTLTEQNLNNKVAWFEGGTITGLRFDPTGDAGGRIEISEIKLFGPRTTPVWDKTAGFDGWRANTKDVRCEVKDGVLTLTEIGKSPQVVSGPLKLDSSRLDRFSFRYRVTKTGSGKRRWGFLFFAHPGKRFVDKNRWNIPPFQTDGQWHVMTLTEKNLADPSAWHDEGPIALLRFDPAAPEGSEIEISEIRFTASPEAAKKKSGLNKPRRPLPPVQYSLDADKWPTVKPEYKSFESNLSGNEHYFRGKMIKCPQDLPQGGKHSEFFLRREFELKGKPVQAWLQFVADDSAEAFFNGIAVSKNQNWRVTEAVEVSSELKAGKNVWGFKYANARSAGGVFGELYVQYADGSFERFDTDGHFVSSVVKADGWSKPGFDASGWEKVIEQDGPPNFPWVVKAAYNDYAMPQRFLGGKAAPASAKAGETVKFRFDFQGKPVPGPIGAVLKLLQGESVAWTERVMISPSSIKLDKGGKWSIELDYRLPLYLNSNQLTARLESGSIFCKNGGFPELKFSLTRIDHDPAFGRETEARIGQSADYGPHVVLNGKPVFFAWGVTNPTRRPDRLPRFGDAPLNLVTVWSGTNEVWPECGKFHPAVFDRYAEAWRRENPDAWFIWDLTICPPVDWAQKYPDEMCLDEKGEINHDLNGRINYSFSSQQARKDMAEIIVKSIEYLEKAPYANRIIGYRVNCGHGVEWLGWDPSKPRRALDFSPAAKKAFEAFARKHYPQLKDYSIPTWSDRHQLDDGELLWDPAKHLSSIAYHDFYSNAQADLLIYLCGKAKAALKHKKLVGTYFVYVSTLNGSGESQMRAHYALKKVLDSKTVDFLLSPQGYAIRNIGDTCGDMKPFGSIRNAGVIPAIEDDARTHCGAKTGGIYQTVTEQASVGVVRRDLGIALCRNEIPYLYAIWNGTDFDFPALAADYGKVRKVGEFCLERKVRRNARIAVVFSEKTVTAMPMLSGPYERTKLYQNYKADGTVLSGLNYCKVLTHESFIGNATRFARLGAPVDYLLAEDLKDHPGDYQLYIFLNCFVYDKAFLEAVEKLRQRKCVLFWVYAPGYTFEGKNSVENMKRLTGIELAKSGEPLVPAVKLNNGEWMGGRTTRFSPCFYVTDPKAEVLGVNEIGKPGLAAVKTANAESIFSCAYQLEVPFLTALAKRAGIHIYSENSDPMEANESLFSLHARFAGRKTVKLPRKTDVLDVFNGKIIARDTDTFTFEAPLHSSWLFYYGKDAGELLKKLQNGK